MMMILSALSCLTSCLKSDNDETVYYDDAGITSFTLGTLNRYVHTLSKNGADSIYKTTVTGSKYAFYIDQNAREIYNPDSLPYGTDASHIICTVLTKNSGVVAIKSMVSDSVRWYSSSDSIDFTQPREFIVYSNSNKAMTRYKVRVNVHQEEGNVFNWTQAGSSSLFANLKGMKGMAVGKEVLVFGTTGEETVVIGYGADGWTQRSSALGAFSEDAWKNVVEKDGVLFMKSGTQLLRRTADGEWEKTADVDLQQLVASSSSSLYAISRAGVVVSSDDNGLTWEEEEMDADAALLPTQDISYVCTPVKTNTSLERLVLVGNRNETAYHDEKVAVVWSKIEDRERENVVHSWSYNGADELAKFPLPRLRGLTVVGYGDGMVAVGGSGLGDCSVNAFAHIYESLDGGLAWKTRSYLPLPSGLQCNDGIVAMMTDADNNLWLVCGGSGQVWRGRLNRLGWQENQTSFTK